MMWSQMSLMAWERAISGAPPANLRNSSETGIGFVIPLFTLGFLVEAALAPAAAPPAFLAPAAGDIRKRDPRKNLATAAIALGVLRARALASRIVDGGEEGLGGFRVLRIRRPPRPPFCIWGP